MSELEKRLRDLQHTFTEYGDHSDIAGLIDAAACIAAEFEREECAKLCERARDELYGKGWQGEKSRAAANTLSLAIRARTRRER